MKGFGGMKAGDQWKLYIPYPLAYGKDGTEGIPGYSTLIFDAVSYTHLDVYKRQLY